MMEEIRSGVGSEHAWIDPSDKITQDSFCSCLAHQRVIDSLHLGWLTVTVRFVML